MDELPCNVLQTHTRHCAYPKNFRIQLDITNKSWLFEILVGSQPYKTEPILNLEFNVEEMLHILILRLSWLIFLSGLLKAGEKNTCKASTF